MSIDNEKLEHLESLIILQERQIQDLSDMVVKQWDEIEILKTRMNRTQEKIKSIEETSSASGGDVSVSDMAAMERPPHY